MRTYINTTWNNADTNDYSGRQQHFKANGAANIHAYAQEDSPKKIKKAREPDFRLTSEKTIDRLEKHRAELEAAFESGKLSFERYELLLSEWETKMDRAWKRHEKASGIVQESTTVVKPSAIPKAVRPSILPVIERAAVSFSSRHPFATLVTVIVLGSMVMNIFGFGA